MEIKIGDRVRFVRYEPHPWQTPFVEGVVLGVLTNSNGSSRYRLRLDELSPQDGEPLEWLVWGHSGSIEKVEEVSNAANR